MEDSYNNPSLNTGFGRGEKLSTVQPMGELSLEVARFSELVGGLESGLSHLSTQLSSVSASTPKAGKGSDKKDPGRQTILAADLASSNGRLTDCLEYLEGIKADLRI